LLRTREIPTPENAEWEGKESDNYYITCITEDVHFSTRKDPKKKKTVCEGKKATSGQGSSTTGGKRRTAPSKKKDYRQKKMWTEDKEKGRALLTDARVLRKRKGGASVFSPREEEGVKQVARLDRRGEGGRGG